MQALVLLRKQLEELKDTDAKLQEEIDTRQEKVKTFIADSRVIDSQIAILRSELFSLKQQRKRNNKNLSHVSGELIKIEREL